MAGGRKRLKVREVIALIGNDGWFLVRTVGITDSSIIRRRPAPSQ
jgi:hypothetical protein